MPTYNSKNKIEATRDTIWPGVSNDRSQYHSKGEETYQVDVFERQNDQGHRIVEGHTENEREANVPCKVIGCTLWTVWAGTDQTYKVHSNCEQQNGDQVSDIGWNVSCEKLTIVA